MHFMFDANITTCYSGGNTTVYGSLLKYVVRSCVNNLMHFTGDLYVLLSILHDLNRAAVLLVNNSIDYKTPYL